MNKPDICLYFDDVVCQCYENKSNDYINGELTPGIIPFIENISKTYNVNIFSYKSYDEKTNVIMQNWFWEKVTGEKYDPDNTIYVPVWLLKIKWPTVKPNNCLVIDKKSLIFFDIINNYQKKLNIINKLSNKYKNYGRRSDGTRIYQNDFEKEMLTSIFEVTYE